MIYVNKVVINADKVSRYNGKNWRSIVSNQVDGETIIPLFIKAPKNIFSYCVSQYIKNSAYTMSFNASEVKTWKTQYEKIWNGVQSQLFENMATEPIK